MAYVLAWNIQQCCKTSLAEGQAKYSYYFIEHNQLSAYRQACDNYLTAWGLEDAIVEEVA